MKLSFRELLSFSFYCILPVYVCCDLGNQGRNNAVDASHCSIDSQSVDRPKPLFIGDGYEVLEILPHDSQAFTQGLTFFDNKLYEGTGLYDGASELRLLSKIDPSKILRRSKPLANHLFGEGIAFFHDENGRSCIIQLTWKAKLGFIYDAETFEMLKQFSFQTGTGEGWGITYNDQSKEFVVSDGSDFLYFLDRDTLQVKRRIQVTLDRARVDPRRLMRYERMWYLNELEFVRHSSRSCKPFFMNNNGKLSDIILANVWYEDVLLAINAQTGEVMRIFDFSKLYQSREPSADVFNGVSISEEPGVFYVTGKFWPNVYKVRLIN